MTSAVSYGALLDAVRGVHWQARRAVTGALAGTHHSKQRGTSAEFTEYRLYRQGDDPRRIDWRLLARSDRAYIRLATDRAILPTAIVLDASSSMAFPIATREKWRRAQEITVALAAVVHADGDPVGIGIQDDSGRMHIVPPRTRRGVVGEITRIVDSIDPDGTSDLAPIVQAVRSRRIAIVTDLLGDAQDLLRVARVHIVGGGEVHLVHMIAREELDPPRRMVLAADPEQPDVQRLLIESTRRDYDTSFRQWRTDMARQWRAAGASYTEVIADEPAAHAVRRIAEPLAYGAPRP
jgi:uncharacterized protein (DUF58 family)